jgi:magnesium transporter
MKYILVGVLSLKDLIVANIEAHVEEVMIQRVVSVNVEEDQESFKDRTPTS